MAKKIESLTLSTVTDLLKEGYVVSKKSNPKTNIVQMFYEDKKLKILRFDSYGRKVEKICQTLSQNEVDQILEQYIWRNEEKHKWYYHKRRISAKEKDSCVIDEKSAKIMVYNWLLERFCDTEAVIVPEISFEDRRADYVVFGDREVCAVEIKSEVDTLDRLEDQIATYAKFSNIIYIAIHKSKIKKLKNLDIPKFVGIIEIGDKIRVVKSAKKRSIDFRVLQDLASYEEFSFMKRGLKGHSTVGKMDIKALLDKFVSIEDQGKYFFELIKNRHREESQKRKDKYREGDMDCAVGSSLKVGINRMRKNNHAFQRTLKDSLGLEETFLKECEEILREDIYRIYNDWKYIDLILTDWSLFMKILKSLNIPYRSTDSKFLKLFLLVEEADVFLKNKIKIEGMVQEGIKRVREAGLIYSSIIIETSSVLATKIIREVIEAAEEPVETMIMRADFYGTIDKKTFNQCNVLVIQNSIHKIYRVEEGIERMRLFQA